MRESDRPNRRERVLNFLVLLPMIWLVEFYDTTIVPRWRNWQTRRT